MKNCTRIALAAALSVPALTGPLVASASAQAAWFNVKNVSGATLTRFYASPSHTNSWERDILGSGVLRSGRISRVTIRDGRRTCYYDFRSVFANGRSFTRYNVNICSLGTYTLY